MAVDHNITSQRVSRAIVAEGTLDRGVHELASLREWDAYRNFLRQRRGAPRCPESEDDNQLCAQHRS